MSEELKKTDHITQESILRSRLEKGERGIPKIPDSPDTRHAQAQPPEFHPDRFAKCVYCGSGIQYQRAIPEHGIPYAYWFSDGAGNYCPKQGQYKHSPRPAEQPAPPLIHQMTILGPNLCVHCGTRLTERNLEEICPARAGASQPSAPPQPAAEPSVEAQQEAPGADYAGKEFHELMEAAKKEAFARGLALAAHLLRDSGKVAYAQAAEYIEEEMEEQKNG